MPTAHGPELPANLPWRKKHKGLFSMKAFVMFHRAKERLQKKSPISLQGFHNLAGIPRCCQMYRSLCFVRLAGCPLSILSIGFGLKPHLQEMTDPIALGFNLSASHPVARQRQAAPATGSGPAEERVTIERMEL